MLIALGVPGWAGCGAEEVPDAGPGDGGKATSAAPTDAVRVGGPLVLRDLEGTAVDPFQASEGPVRVFLFMRTDCPIGNRYVPEIRQLCEGHAAAGVDFWLVYPDPAETPDTIRRHLDAYACPGRPLRDPDHALVQLSGAETTPEAAVFQGRRMVYRGRIDNRFVDFGKTRTVTTSHELRDVLQSLRNGGPVTVPWHEAVGCPIARLP